nr:glutathione transferase 1-1 - rat (fragments) [Rattus norvegicus]
LIQSPEDLEYLPAFEISSLPNV